MYPGPVSVNVGAGVGAILVVGLHVYACTLLWGGRVEPSRTLPKRACLIQTLLDSMTRPYPEVGCLWSLLQDVEKTFREGTAVRSMPWSLINCFGTHNRRTHIRALLWATRRPARRCGATACPAHRTARRNSSWSYTGSDGQTSVAELKEDGVGESRGCSLRCSRP